ncbi:NAD(P)-dependent oxidoreductase [Mucilaginibacter sp. HD30]
MKIVILDGHTINPGDISWQGLQQLGEVVIHERTAPHQLLERAARADILLSNKTPITASVISQLPHLKYIGLLAIGYNVIDVDAAKKQGIVVANAPGYGTTSVVQQTFALLLELIQRTQRHSDSVMAGDWARSVDFCYWKYPLVELAGKTIGIIGFGHIGQKVGDVATAFGMNIIGNSRTRTDQSARTNFRWAEVPGVVGAGRCGKHSLPLISRDAGPYQRRKFKKDEKLGLSYQYFKGTYC